MSEVFLRMETRPSEELKGEIANERGLNDLLDSIYNSLADNEAVEIHIYQDYILVGKRTKGHGDRFFHKFTNFGFSPNRSDNKSRGLTYAIRTIDSGSLPTYCYDAINGDVDALRKTTEHLIRALTAKVKRMTEKGKDAALIEEFEKRRFAAERRLTLPVEELVVLSEPIIVEIPKDPSKFYDEEDVVISKEE